jgi:hypothetical protein
MKFKIWIMVLTLGVSSTIANAGQFECRYTDRDNQSNAEIINFNYLPTDCTQSTGNMCVIPLQKLETKFGCRFFDMSLWGKFQPELQIKLTENCSQGGNESGVQMNIEPESKSFKLRANFGGLTSVTCYLK